MDSHRTNPADIEQRRTRSRGRGLAALSERFAPADIVGFLTARSRQATSAALEIGSGEGRAMLDLMRAVPGIRVAGINREPWPAMTGVESLRGLAIDSGVFTAEAFDQKPTPELVFQDASALPWPDATFDVVYSQYAIHYVERKDWLIEEVWRVLKPGGRAYLHIDTRKASAPDFLRTPSPRFLVYRRGRLLSPDACLKSRTPSKAAVQCREVTRGANSEVHVLMERNVEGALALGLTFDAASSFDLHRLHDASHSFDDYWGHRSVFRVG